MVGIGIKYLFWLPFIIVVLADIIDLIDSSIKTKEKEADF